MRSWYRCPKVASGCFALYRTAVVKQLGGFPTETVGEDLDLTWRLYEADESIKYVSSTICCPVEPPDLHFMRKQLTPWSQGFAPSVRLHGRRILGVPMLRSFAIVASLDALLDGLLYLVVMPFLMVAYGWRYLIAVYP